MGAVLRAFDPDLGRDLAVKVLREEFRGRAGLERRFLEEARLTGRLQHPGVVPVVEAGRLADGRPFFTMKLVQGRTLADLLRERPDPSRDLPRLLAVFEQVCQTMAFAHSRGVIHRDLKPSNVMVGEFGEVQVMDWGLAKAPGRGEGADPSAAAAPPSAFGGSEAVTVLPPAAPAEMGPARTTVGAVLGTYAYMPPEQARGEVDRLDARCDVFALGAMLCEILTGRPPYEGAEGVDLWRQASEGEQSAALARLAACGADAGLVRLAIDCLAPEAAARPADAGVVAEAVAAHRRSVAERLRAAELAGVRAEEKARRERQRRLWAAALAASVGLTLAVLATGGWWAQWRQAEADRAQAEADRKAAAAQAEADRRAAAAGADLDAAEEAARAGQDGRAREALERAEGRLAGGGPPELRD
jgi:serine/threonine-protein kinase